MTERGPRDDQDRDPGQLSSEFTGSRLAFLFSGVYYKEPCSHRDSGQMTKLSYGPYSLMEIPIYHRIPYPSSPAPMG